MQQNAQQSENISGKLKLQIALIKKIVQSGASTAKHRFPEILAYQISKYLFKNSFRAKKTLYSLSKSNELKLNQEYVLSRVCLNEQRLPQDFKTEELPNQLSNEGEKSKEKIWVNNRDKNLHQHSCYLTMMKTWKAMVVNETDYNEVLQRGRMLLVFLSNIKLFSDNNIKNENTLDPFKDFHKYQKNQRELKKYHYLISDNLPQIQSYFESIFLYQKDKKLNGTVIKAFISLMSKDMALVKLQQNYNTLSLQCQGKYLYVESKFSMALKPKRNLVDQGQFPALFMRNNHWILVDQRDNYSFKLLEAVTYPLPWGRHTYLTRNLTAITKTDVWIEQQQAY